MQGAWSLSSKPRDMEEVGWEEGGKDVRPAIIRRCNRVPPKLTVLGIGFRDDKDDVDFPKRERERESANLNFKERLANHARARAGRSGISE